MSSDASGIKVFPIASAVVGSVFLLAVILGGLRAWFLQVRHQEVQERVLAVPTTDIALREVREDSLLATYGWANEDSSEVRIPIEKAMDLVVEQANRRTGRGGR